MILTIRESQRTKQICVKLVCQMSMGSEQESLLLDFLRDATARLNIEEYELTGLCVERHDGKGLYIPNDADQIIVIQGKMEIREELLGKQFMVPINSFFQVHTPLAELLYQKV